MINLTLIRLPPLTPAMVPHQREGLGKGKRDALTLTFPVTLLGCWRGGLPVLEEISACQNLLFFQTGAIT